MIHPQIVNKNSECIGDDCAYCKQPFTTGDEVVACPHDAVRHHSYCWQENGSRCTALACDGAGELGEAVPDTSGRDNANESAAPSPQIKPIRAILREAPSLDRSRRALPVAGRAEPYRPPSPETDYLPIELPQNRDPDPHYQEAPLLSRVARNCFFSSVVIATLLMAASCYGIWAIAGSLAP